MPGTYEPIQTVTVSGSSTTSMVFNSIPSTYKDLVIVWVGSAAASMIKVLNFNGASSTYSCTVMYNQGSVVRAAGNYSSPYLDVVNAGANGAMCIVNIFDYTNTTTYKNYISKQSSSSTSNELIFGTWQSTSAITSLTINTHSSNAFTDGTTATLYGIKGA